MQNRELDAKIAVISQADAAKLGIKKDEENLVSVNGQAVDVEWIDEYSEDWHLPRIILKAQAYLKSLKEPATKRNVNVYSNKYENFERIVDFDVIEGTSLDKVRKFLLLNEYGPESAIDEFCYGKTTVTNKQDVKKVIDKIANNIKIYQKENDDNEDTLATIDARYENFELTDEEYLNEKTDALASLQIMSLSIYRDLVLLNSLSQRPIDWNAVNASTSPDQLLVKLNELKQKVEDEVHRHKEEKATVPATATGVVANNKVESAEKVPGSVDMSHYETNVQNWAVDAVDPSYVENSVWSAEEFQNVNAQSTVAKSQPVIENKEESKVVAKSVEPVVAPTPAPVVEAVSVTKPVETTKVSNFEAFEQQDVKEIADWNTGKDYPKVNDEDKKPVAYDLEMTDPIYWYHEEWNVDSFGGKKSDAKHGGIKGLFRDLKLKKDKNLNQEVSDEKGYYVVELKDHRKVKVAIDDKNFLGNPDYLPHDFTKEAISKWAPAKTETTNKPNTSEPQAKLTDLETSANISIDEQIDSIKNDIDALESQLNQIKNK